MQEIDQGTLGASYPDVGEALVCFDELDIPLG